MAQITNFVQLIMIMISLPQYFAPWNKDSVYVPDPGSTQCCESWIRNSGFHAMRTDINYDLAYKRDRKFDRVVPIWAAIYAHVYVTFIYPIIQRVSYTPYEYCHDRNLEKTNILPFENYTNFQSTCEGWLQLYNYKIDDPSNDNWVVARNREIFEDGVISLWVAVYSLLLSSFEKIDAISITDYCSVMVNKNEKMLFMSLNETTMSCKKWIELSGFDDHVPTNIKKAKRERTKFLKYKTFINSWTIYYVEHILNSRTKIRCFGCLSASSSIGDIDDSPKSPLDFCTEKGYPETSPVGYFKKKSTMKSCENWITSSGFKVGRIDKNYKLARKRDRKFDGVVPIWAAIYAHVLTSFPYAVIQRISYSPYQYCHDHNLEYNNELPFQNFANFQRTCEEWLQLYNYHIYDPTKLNWVIARNREPSEDGDISLWVAFYASLISAYKRSATISITDFCDIMIQKEEKLHFMSLNETTMSCAKWIELSGFSDCIPTNIRKVKKEKKKFQKFKLFINSWTVYYFEHLLQSDDFLETNIKCFNCASPRSFTNITDNDTMTPSNFCRENGYPETYPVRYFK